MNTPIVLLVCFAAAFVIVGGINTDNFSPEYLQYCKEHGKVVSEEKAKVFSLNLARINAHNSNPTASFQMGVNQFTDMTEEEIKAWKGSYSDSPFKNTPILKDQDLPQAPPDSFDWRAQGAVTPIKDQQACGVCWAFASTSAVESAHFIATKQLISLSESQQANCDTTGGCNECAFQWLETNQPCTEDSFSYKCPDTRGCPKCSPGAPKLKTFVKLPLSNETAMKAGVYAQPVAIGIAAAGDFMSYKSGIFDGSCPGGRDHAVVLVGYGSQNGKDFWILRNSWGTGWGEAGYMRISRGAHGPDGICILATDPSIPQY